jgi:Cu2+-exporting ATPase
VPGVPEPRGQWLLLGDRQGPLAWFGLDDRLRDDAADLVAACKARGWQTLLLSGDSSPMVAEVAATLGIDQAVGGLRPDDKLERLTHCKPKGARC